MASHNVRMVGGCGNGYHPLNLFIKKKNGKEKEFLIVFKEFFHLNNLLGAAKCEATKFVLLYVFLHPFSLILNCYVSVQ
jgi:hypothetical protein